MELPASYFIVLNNEFNFNHFPLNVTYVDVGLHCVTAESLEMLSSHLKMKADFGREIAI